MRILTGTLAALALLLPAPALAQEVVGTALIGGKKVELLDDQSWRYADGAQPAPGCETIDAVIEICGRPKGWTSLSTEGTEYVRMYKLGDTKYVGVLPEGLGTNDGVTMDYMRNIVIENAAMASGVNAADIPVLGVETVTASGINGDKVTYVVTFNGLDFVFQNTILNGPNNTIQIISWDVGKTLKDETRDLHQAFVDKLRIDFGRGRT